MKIGFGTDGIRGIYGGEMSEDVAYALGRAFCRIKSNPLVVVGRDPRVSGESLAAALYMGIAENGGEIINTGILPTNAVSFFTRYFHADYGVMITASHNPPEYNGLKVFDEGGAKLGRTREKRLEDYLKNDSLRVNSDVALPPFEKADVIYADYIFQSLPVKLDFKIALDCAHGCAAELAENVFLRAGAAVTAINNIRDGTMINRECGAINPVRLTEFMKGKDFDLGFSFDGDADRLAVAENGARIDNNVVFYCMAKYMKENNLLRNNIVVGTVLTNSGFERALASIGLRLLRSDVGDRNVFELMERHNASLGGEDSGHYILADYEKSSDALINALFTARIKRERGNLSDYASELKMLPSKTCDLEVGNDFELADLLAKSIIERLMQSCPDCRCIIRRSGTESKLRLLIESDDGDYAANALKKLKEIIKDSI